MKPTNIFYKEFRPKTESKQEEECRNSSTLLSSDDVLMRARLTLAILGLTTSNINLQKPTAL